jgi:hypothetical protein
MSDMVEKNIEELDRRAAQNSLDGLEADIWAGVAERGRETKISRALLTLQGAMLVFALISSVAVGHLAGASRRATSELAVFSGRLDVAPSTLLDGSKI